MKQSSNSSAGNVRIGIGKLSALNACLSTAKTYNRNFEDPVFQLPPQKIAPPKNGSKEPILSTKNEKLEKENEKTAEVSKPKRFLNFINSSNEKKKEFIYDEYDEFHEDHPRNRPFTKDRNRSFSPQPHIRPKENNEYKQKPKDFKRSRGILNDLEPDITIDMRTQENTNIFDLNLSETANRLLKQRNISNLFPLQAQAFEPIKSGIDFIGKAKTGTGKTMAFALPLLEKLRESKERRQLRVLVISPTRELANQITEEFKYYGPEFKTVCCYGGVSLTKQISLINYGVDIIVATPGRILDLMGRDVITLNKISAVVIDEADHMMDIGFKDDLDEILNIVNNNSKDIQLLLFSATMPPSIRNIASSYLKEKRLFIDAVGNENQTADKIIHYAIPCTDDDLERTLELIITFYAYRGKALIFTDTKSHVSYLTSRMLKTGLRVGCLHGDMNQYSRDQTITAYKNGEINCLIATDVAARGLDIPNVELVFQVRPPQNISYYIHRSGRTGRVGRVGISVLMYNPKEDDNILYEIEKKASIEFTRRGIPTKEEFEELALNVQEELKETRSKDKEDLLLGRFRSNNYGSQKVNLESCLSNILKSREFFSRSLIDGSCRKTTLLMSGDKKRTELIFEIEKLLEGIYIFDMVFCKDGSVLIDIKEEDKNEALKRINNQIFLKGSLPILIPEIQNSRFEGYNQSNSNYGKKDKKYKNNGQDRFHKTISQKSNMNDLGNNSKKPYPSFNFFVRKKDFN